MKDLFFGGNFSENKKFDVCLFVCGSVAGMCQPRVLGTVGAEPFSAKLRYTGTEDTDHPNLIKLTVTMPHIDGKSYTVNKQ